MAGKFNPKLSTLPYEISPENHPLKYWNKLQQLMYQSNCSRNNVGEIVYMFFIFHTFCKHLRSFIAGKELAGPHRGLTSPPNPPAERRTCCARPLLATLGSSLRSDFSGKSVIFSGKLILAPPFFLGPFAYGCTPVEHKCTSCILILPVASW